MEMNLTDKTVYRMGGEFEQWSWEDEQQNRCQGCETQRNDGGWVRFFEFVFKLRILRFAEKGLKNYGEEICGVQE